VLDLPLAGLVDEPLGVSAYMRLEALNELMREGPAISGAWLMTRAEARARLYARLWEASRVAGIGLISETGMDCETTWMTRARDMMSILAAAGRLDHLRAGLQQRPDRVCRARARTGHAARARLFPRQVGWVLVGEIALLTLLAIPLGWLLGTLFRLVAEPGLQHGHDADSVSHRPPDLCLCRGGRHPRLDRCRWC
jgi:putative ABC transport system permease protein